MTRSLSPRLAGLPDFSLVAVFILCSATTIACADKPVAPIDPTRVAAGKWGADGAGAIVTDSVMHVHIGCTYGDILGIVSLDQNGTFSRDGSYMPRAYPIAVGPSVPARFVGRSLGRSLTITVTVNDTVTKTERVYGPVVVTFGVEPNLGPCPICTVPGMKAPMKPNFISRLRRSIASSMSQARFP